MDAGGEVIDELYRVAPEDFVSERDARVAAAKERDDRDAAKAIGAVRRPSRAAWLTNLLVHDRPDDVEGLLGLADTLAAAQRTLDGAALRQVSAQRNKLVGALSRRAAELGRESGHRVDSTLEREVRGILEAALADPELAGRVRSGRLVRAERHAGFGPGPEAGAVPRPDGNAGDGRTGRTGSEQGSDGRGRDGRATGGTDGAATTESTPGDGVAGDAPESAAARREAERREREIARAEAELEKAERAAREARDGHGRAQDAASEAADRQERARERVAELVEELDRTREESAAANRAAHAANRAEREAARGARSAETARDRAAAAVDELRST